MSDWWGWGEHGPRRAAKNGIPARSQRGDIGESWWSKRFIEALQAVTDAGRLSRGRSYARTGQVMDLVVEPGRVTSRVQGSAPTPYAVSIALAPFTDAEWARAEDALAGEALFAAALLAGEMPRDVEQAFAAAGLTLFPTKPRELRTDCSCPDAANPCKHVAATYYILAEVFDTDPFLVLAWRGRPRERLLERLRELRAPAPDEPPPAPADAAEELAPAADFWRAGPELAELRFTPRAADTPDAVLRELGPLPDAAGGHPVAAALAEAYRIFTAHAGRRALGDADADAEGENGEEYGGESADEPLGGE
ncbi:MAG TPA: SWIM zinc finger family protein [Longimicrobium sp.]|nr:SWIM zinc finger family protein [Longimicrobium sp.]